MEARHGALRLIDLGESAGTIFVESGAELGKAEAPRGPVHQLGAKAILTPLHMLLIADFDNPSRRAATDARSALECTHADAADQVPLQKDHREEDRDRAQD